MAVIRSVAALLNESPDRLMSLRGIVLELNKVSWCAEDPRLKAKSCQGRQQKRKIRTGDLRRLIRKSESIKFAIHEGPNHHVASVELLQG